MTGLTESEMAEVKGFMHPDLAAEKRCEAWVKMARFRVGRGYFGDSYPYALALMASHIGALEMRGAEGDGGSVASKREGDLSVSYASGANGDDGDLSATSYGRQYMSLLKQYGTRPGVTGPADFRRFCGGAGRAP